MSWRSRLGGVALLEASRRLILGITCDATPSRLGKEMIMIIMHEYLGLGFMSHQVYAAALLL